MPDQTVTRTIESDLAPERIFATLSDASLIPQWAPIFAEKIEHLDNTAYRFTKGPDTFNVDLLTNPQSLTADYIREMPNGKRGGAYIRTMPRPLGGSTTVMTVPLGPGSTSVEVANVLDQELKALLQLSSS